MLASAFADEFFHDQELGASRMLNIGEKGGKTMVSKALVGGNQRY